MMRELVRHRLFFVGAGVRILLLAIVIPCVSCAAYTAFESMAAGQLIENPWTYFMRTGGIDGLPQHSYLLSFFCWPIVWLCEAILLPGYWGFGIVLLIADVSMLVLLGKLVQISPRQLLIFYWLSPIVLFATYWLGLDDLIPITLLVAALYAIKRLHAVKAGLLCAAAIAIKIGAILAVPFFCIYLYRNRALRNLTSAYLQGLVAALILLYLPFLASPQAVVNMIDAAEVKQALQFIVHIGTTPIYVLPLIYLLVLYVTWEIRRIGFVMLSAFLGLAFFVVALLMPEIPGWYVWFVPLLVSYQVLGGASAIRLTKCYSLIYVAYNILASPRALIFQVNFADQLAAYTHQNSIGMVLVPVLHTSLIAFGMVLVWCIWRTVIHGNEFYRYSRKPFVVGIAGDSGSGKDTLANALRGLFGSHSVAQLSGDDYHLWDRQKPMWQVMTHLNPRANNLKRYTQDLMRLVGGKSILSSHYDHASGKMLDFRRVDSNDVIIASGLHALHLPMLRECYDLSIYLDMDDGLRRHFKLQRDVYQRGHSAEKVLSSLEKREGDSEHFIRPQAQYADLVMSLQPISERGMSAMEGAGKSPLHLRLTARSRLGLNEESLVRVLVGVCGLHVDMTHYVNNEVGLVIEGDTSSEDIALAARLLFPTMQELFDTKPQFEDGMLGLMQLVALSHIHQSLSRRIL